jgi:hypothetical protein
MPFIKKVLRRGFGTLWLRAVSACERLEDQGRYNEADRVRSDFLDHWWGGDGYRVDVDVYELQPTADPWERCGMHVCEN